MATSPQVKDKVLVSKDTFYGHRVLQVNVKQDMVAAAVWNYDVAAILGAEAVKYDIPKTEVQAFVLDNEVGSVTEGYYVAAGAVAGIGFKEDGKVRVVNQHTGTLSFLIRVIIYRKPL